MSTRTLKAAADSTGPPMTESGVRNVFALLGGGAGALAGGGIGGVAGLLRPSRDEEGNTHRMRNGLLGAGVGGLLGAGGGAFLGDSFGDLAVTTPAEIFADSKRNWLEKAFMPPTIPSSVKDHLINAKGHLINAISAPGRATGLQDDPSFMDKLVRMFKGARVKAASGLCKQSDLAQIALALGDTANPYLQQLLGQQMDPKQLGQTLMGAGAGGALGAGSSFVFPEGADENGPYVGRSDMFNKALLGAILGGVGGYNLKAASFNPSNVMAGLKSTLGLGEDHSVHNAQQVGNVLQALKEMRTGGEPVPRAVSTGGVSQPLGVAIGRKTNVGNPELFGKTKLPPTGPVSGIKDQMRRELGMPAVPAAPMKKKADMNAIIKYIMDMPPEQRQALTWGLAGGAGGLAHGMFTGHPFRNALIGGGLGAGLGYSGLGAGMLDKLKQTFGAQPPQAPALPAGVNRAPGTPNPFGAEPEMDLSRAGGRNPTPLGSGNRNWAPLALSMVGGANGSGVTAYPGTSQTYGNLPETPSHLRNPMSQN